MTSFRRITHSGTCLCGHNYEDHHLGAVLNPDAYAVMGPYLPEECESYVDAEEPNQEVRARWQGTKR